MLTNWMQLPELASLHGATVDALNVFVHIFMGVLAVGWTLFLIFVFWRFHQRRSAKANYTGVRSHASTHVEVGVVIVEAILLLGFAFPFWAQRVAAFPIADPTTVRLRAVGYQFGWAFHYPGPDGKFGRVHPDLYLQDPAGLDREDPNGQDDVVSVGNLVLPKDRSVVIEVTSRDVIHNLALHPMRTAQDAIPGAEYPMWFTPTKTGEWEIICGQLCGAGHASMKAMMEVRSAEEFDQWIADNTPAPAADSAADAATTEAAGAVQEAADGASGAQP